jgi:putative tricarboxylic transport membrane protein
VADVNRTAVERGMVDILLSAVGVAAMVAGHRYGVLGEDGRVGPGFMPMLAGGLMAAFGVLDLALQRWSRSSGEPDLVDADGSQALEGADVDLRGRTLRQRRRLLTVVFALLLGTILLVQVVGFLLAFGLLIFVCSFGLEKHRLLPSLLVSAVAVTATYGVFVIFLHVPLPAGSLGVL